MNTDKPFRANDDTSAIQPPEMNTTKSPAEIPIRRWTVTRIVHELYDVEARTRKEALDKAEDPHTVYIKGERAVLNKLANAKASP